MIESMPFGSTKLTGNDAKAFMRQVRHGRTNKRAVKAIRRGVEMVREFNKTGKVVLHQPKIK